MEKLPKCYRRRTGAQHGNKSSKLKSFSTRSDATDFKMKAYVTNEVFIDAILWRRKSKVCKKYFSYENISSKLLVVMV